MLESIQKHEAVRKVVIEWAFGIEGTIMESVQEHERVRDEWLAANNRAWRHQPRLDWRVELIGEPDPKDVARALRRAADMIEEHAGRMMNLPLGVTVIVDDADSVEFAGCDAKVVASARRASYQAGLRDHVSSRTGGRKPHNG